MARRAAAVTGGLILLMTLSPAAADHGATLKCGTASPFENICYDYGPAVMGSSAPVAQANLIGFWGAVEIKLIQPGASWKVECWAALVPEMWGDCGPPTGSYIPGVPVILRCQAKSTSNGPGSASTGPSGTWGCKVSI